MATKAQLEHKNKQHVIDYNKLVDKFNAKQEECDSLRIKANSVSGLKADNAKFIRRLDDLKLTISSYLEVHAEYDEVDTMYSGKQMQMVETQETKHLNVLLNLIRGN